MKKLIQMISAAALVLSFSVPATIVMSGDALALTKKQARKCHYYAEQKARKKTNKSAFTGLVVGGIGGALLGDAVGGKKSTIIGGAGGAAAGLAVGGTQYDKYYHRYFKRCAAQYDEDYEDDY
jgi:uncharacterized protein YcfJ